jgi:cytoskeletal protein CcmA (bactofilin family)
MGRTEARARRLSGNRIVLSRDRVIPAWASGSSGKVGQVFKRRKPEEPRLQPLAQPQPPPGRGHVIASGLESPGATRPEQRGVVEPSDALASGGPDATLNIPAMPEVTSARTEAPSLQPAPAVTAPPQPKESIFMSRPPLQPTPPANPTMPTGLSRPPMAPTRMPAQSGERRTLVVGRGISVQGTIQDAERLVVEGTVEASSLNATELQIAQGGVLKGQVEVEDAEISGMMDGILTVKGSLLLHGTGQVIGEARCRRLQVEDGGQLSGKISMLTDSTPTAAPSFQPADHDAA